MAAVFFCGSIVWAQDWKGKARIDGRVLNERGQPVEKATVQLRQAGSNTGPDVFTNSKGRWAYMGLAGGEWNIDVSAPGYLTKKRSLRLSDVYRLPPLEMQLEPAPQAAPQPAPEVPKDASAEIIAALERGNLLLEQKNYAEARAEYERALAAVPDNPIILRGIARTYYGENRLDEAIATLKKAVEKDPNDTEAILLLASLHLEKGNLEEGKAILLKLPPEVVKDPGIYVNAGILLLNKKKPQDAWEQFDKAVSLKPDDAEAYFYRGLAGVQLKKKAEARADLQKYLQVAPGGPQAADAKELLKSLR